jgi:hypothetical protein
MICFLFVERAKLLKSFGQAICFLPNDKLFHAKPQSRKGMIFSLCVFASWRGVLFSRKAAEPQRKGFHSLRLRVFARASSPRKGMV